MFPVGAVGGILRWLSANGKRQKEPAAGRASDIAQKDERNVKPRRCSSDIVPELVSNRKFNKIFSPCAFAAGFSNSLNLARIL
jgi:hypothetical protein